MLNLRTTLAALVLAVATTGQLDAEEVATLHNRSSYTVYFYLRWTNIPRESVRLKLAPGETLTNAGPDGARFFVRFDETPLTPLISPAEERHAQLYTLRTYTPGPGRVSSFVNSPYEAGVVGLLTN